MHQHSRKAGGHIPTSLLSAEKPYTTQLQAGLGLVSETKALFELWEPGMSAAQLHKVALESGRFPTVTARRLRNIVSECFAPRYLSTGDGPAANMKRLSTQLSLATLMQLMLVYTSRANPILGDFIRQVYWVRYGAGYKEITGNDARAFVERAIDDGKTIKRWSETTVRRVSAYLTGCCADFGLLQRGQKTDRQVVSFRIAIPTVAYLAHELHFAGVSDNALLTHEDWQLFGLRRDDVLDELKRISLNGMLILQSAGDMIRIGWKLRSMEAVCDVLAES